MRNAWRSLFIRSLSSIPSNPSPMQPSNLHFLLHGTQNSGISRWFFVPISKFRYFSSSEQNNSQMVDIFLKPIGSDEIEAELAAAELSLDHEAVHAVLGSLEERPELARKVFDWVSEKQNRILRSKSYNLMLGVLASEGKSDDFWGLVETMKGKGYGISKTSYLKSLGRFSQKGMEKDLDLLKKTYFLSSHENIVARTCPMICKVLREGKEFEDVQKELDELELSLSPDLVVAVLEQIGSYPKKKVLMFFRWMEEKPSFRMDGSVYNAMLRVLSREDCMEEFLKILQRVKDEVFEMEKKTYIKVSIWFYKRKMIAEAVNLFEFAMNGPEKPQHGDLLLLLKKIVVSKDADMDMISRVVRIYKNAGNSVSGSFFEAVLKVLLNVGKLGECREVLNAMEAGGFVPDGATHNQVVVGLCNAGRLVEAFEYLDGMEKSGHTADAKTWLAFILKHCKDGEVDKALSCFLKLVEGKGGANVSYAFGVLAKSFCKKNGINAAFKMLEEMVAGKQLRPSHSTYKLLIDKLLSQAKLKEALSLFGLMKDHGYPPYMKPFVNHFSKSGTADDAVVFLRAMTVKAFPPKTVFLRMFETLLKAGRHEVAYDLLSKSPSGIRNHADVLELFYSMKPEEAVIAAAI